TRAACGDFWLHLQIPVACSPAAGRGQCGAATQGIPSRSCRLPVARSGWVAFAGGVEQRVPGTAVAAGQTIEDCYHGLGIQLGAGEFRVFLALVHGVAEVDWMNMVRVCADDGQDLPPVVAKVREESNKMEASLEHSLKPKALGERNLRLPESGTDG